MMNFNISTSVDAVAKTSSINFTLNGVAVTSYSFASGLVTMNRRETTQTMTFSNFIKGVDETDRWISQLTLLQPPTTASYNYYLTSNYENNVLTYEYKTSPVNFPGNKKITMKTDYNFNTKVITFYARDETQLTFVDFKLLHNHSRDFLNKIAYISKLM